ncbi:MAG: heat-inducible transcriptional repressor HrcA [Cyanobacteria bacterium P01_A01_bin.17]
MTVQLTKRQQQILRATVNHYIVTAEPVGSKALAQRHSLSPATIRNVMGMLEKVGLLYQPHISAGRVPSDSGYRIYVDKLITPSDTLRQEVEQLLEDRLQPPRRNFETILRHAAQVLSRLSGCVALITRPQTQTSTVRHLQLVPVENQRVMLIMVMDTYETESVLMELPQAPEDNSDPELISQDLQLLANFLNHQLPGRSLHELAALDWQELGREFQSCTHVLQALLSDLIQRAHAASPNPILVGGFAEVLRQPEFSELQQAHPLIHLLEEKQDQLWPLICEWSQHRSGPSETAHEDFAYNKISVRIGSENPLTSIQSCTLVSKTYQKGKTPVGSVGILGPTRMAYDKVMTMVEATANYLSNYLSQPA